MLICSLKKKKNQWGSACPHILIKENVQKLSLGIFTHSILRTNYFSMCTRFQVFVCTTMSNSQRIKSFSDHHLTPAQCLTGFMFASLFHLFATCFFDPTYQTLKKKNKTAKPWQISLGTMAGGGGEGWLGDLLVHLLGCQGNRDCAVVVSAVFSEWGTRDYRKYDMTFLLEQTALLFSAALSLIFTF